MTEPFTCPPEHKHAAVSTCYQRHGCRCAPCRVATMKARSRRRKDVAFGRYDAVSRFVPAGPARAHVLELLKQRMTLNQIGHLAGITPHVVGVLVGTDNPPRKIIRTNADKLLAVTPKLHTLPDTGFVPATGTTRRIQALMVMGWSMTQQAALAGSHRGCFVRFLTVDRVTAATHRKTKAIYDELWDLAPDPQTTGEKSSVARTKAYAARRGWLPPMAWDDMDTDITPPDPTAAHDLDDESDRDSGDQVLVEMAIAGSNVLLTSRQREEAVTRLNARRLNDGEIANLLHVDKRTVLRIRQRLTLPAAVGPDKQPIAA
jgi:hypothetical protein